MDLNKPVELMNPAERRAYYMARRQAMLAGDGGILPDGKTCRETREQYVQTCTEDPGRTLTHVEGEERAAAAAVMDGEEFPGAPGVVAAELPSEALGPDITNLRCCG